VTDLSPGPSDFDETPAAMANLDLVISIDTSVAHLAGALGRPGWFMPPFGPAWRWLLARIGGGIRHQGSFGSRDPRIGTS
jgi:hypothetical protein